MTCIEPSEESELLDSAFLAWATFEFFFSLLCLLFLCLIALLTTLILPCLPALPAIALTSLWKVRFEYGAFLSLSSFSLALFFNFQHTFVLWVLVLQWVQYLGPDSVVDFWQLFVALFSDFANLFFCCFCGHCHSCHILLQWAFRSAQCAHTH
jgi:hypothetical protein